MVFVYVYRRLRQAKTTRAFRDKLVESVMEELSIAGDLITKERVTVINRSYSEDDLIAHTFQIVIVANDCPLRRKTQEASSKAILAQIALFVPRGCTAGVSVLLLPCAFAEFDPFKVV